MALTLPVNPSVSNATVGKDFLLSVNTGTVAVPVWTLVGGQRSASLSRTADEIDVSDKTTQGWKSAKAGLRSWSIDLDGTVILSDTGLAALEQAFMTGVEINVRLLYPDGSEQTGWGSVTEFSIESPHDGEATVSGTISGNGALGSRTPSISPLTANGDISSPTDIVFSILPTTATVSAVKDGSSALTVTTHYTYSAGTLTIKSAYIATMSAGTHTIYVTTAKATLSVVLVIVE